MTPEEFLRRVEDFVKEIPKDANAWPPKTQHQPERASPFKDLMQKISPKGSPRAGSPVSNIKARLYFTQYWYISRSGSNFNSLYDQGIRWQFCSHFPC